MYELGELTATLAISWLVGAFLLTLYYQYRCQYLFDNEYYGIGLGSSVDVRAVLAKLKLFRVCKPVS